MIVAHIRRSAALTLHSFSLFELDVINSSSTFLGYGAVPISSLLISVSRECPDVRRTPISPPFPPAVIEQLTGRLVSVTTSLLPSQMYIPIGHLHPNSPINLKCCIQVFIVSIN